MKKLFLYLVLVACVPHCVNAAMTDVVRKSAMGVGGTTAVAALAMIIYQSHIIQKLKREKVALESDALRTFEELLPVYQVEQKIREADTIRAKAIAVLAGSAVVGGGGYLWPTQKQPTSPKSSNEPNQGLLSDRSSPASSGVAVTGSNTTDSLPLPSTPLPSAPFQAHVDWNTQEDFDDFALAHILAYAEEQKISDEEIATPSGDNDNIIQCLHTVGVRLTQDCSEEDKAKIQYIAWQRKDRSFSEKITVALPVDFYAAAQTDSLTAQQLPLDCFDVIHVPGDGNCGAHVACLFKSKLLTSKEFCPVFEASLSSILQLRIQLVATLAKLLKGATANYWEKELALRPQANTFEQYRKLVGLEDYKGELSSHGSAFPKSVDSKYWLTDFDFMLLAYICEKTFIIWEQANKILQVNNVYRPGDSSAPIQLEECVNVVNTGGIHWYSVIPKIGLDARLKAAHDATPSPRDI